MRKKIWPVLLLFVMLLSGCGGYGRDLPKESVELVAPPELRILCGEEAVTALKGSYSWIVKHEDGTSTATIADAAHPSQCRDLLPVIETVKTTAELQFLDAPQPQTVRVYCWPEEDLSETADTMIPEEEELLCDGTTFSLKKGGNLYEIVAVWEEELWSGTAHYSFYVNNID